MSRLVEVAIKPFIGSVKIADPMTISQAQLFEDGLESPPLPPEVQQAEDRYAESVKELGEEALETVALRDAYILARKKNRVWNSEKDKRRLPAILACVEKWDIEGIDEKPTLDTFPFTPRLESHELIELLFTEILLVYKGEQKVPNA